MAISVWKRDSLLCNVINNDIINSLYLIWFYILLIILVFWTIYIIIKRKKLINYYKNLKLFYINFILFSFILFISILLEFYLWLENLIFSYWFFILFYGILSYFINKKNKKENKFYIIWFILFILIVQYLYTEHNKCNRYIWTIVGKPIIYLYPEQKQEVKVELEVEWKLIADYPRYDEEIKGWQVTAYPDSTIIEDEKEYSYLFWEAEFENNDWDLSKWFIVEWKDAREFLQEKLSYIWLTSKEYNEFIVYWYPKMMNNKYNLVYFAWLDYTSKAPLNITPEPDSVLRVFTVIKPLKEKIEIQEQVLERFDRKWFSVVEWWWTILE